MMKYTISIILFTMLGQMTIGVGHAAEATEAETAWFAGEWAVTLAPVEGYETIRARTYDNVRIEHRKGTRLARISTTRQGEEQSIEFDVRSFKGNYPWWSVTQGANLVARRVDENTFDLAGVGPMGKADWNRALRHTRVKPEPEVKG